MNFELARTNMVKSQVAPNRVDDVRLLESFLNVPREAFVADSHREFAYSDFPVPLPGGERRFLIPMQAAWLIHALGVNPGDRVLVVGAGTGYEAALLAHLGAQVFAVEVDGKLAALGESLTAAARVEWKVGPLAQGWPEASPFDGILLCGAVGAVSNKLIGQLGKNGRLTAIVGSPGSVVMQGVRMVGISGGDRPERLFETKADHLPGFEVSERFTL